MARAGYPRTINRRKKEREDEVISVSADPDLVSSSQADLPPLALYRFVDWSGQTVDVGSKSLEDVLDRIHNVGPRTVLREKAQEAASIRRAGVAFVYPSEGEFDKIQAAFRELKRDQAREAVGVDL